MRKKAEQRGLEKEEEDYFNEDRYVTVFLLVISSLFEQYIGEIGYSRVLLC